MNDTPREQSDRLRRYTALLAPGTPVREGLDRIVHGHTGALVVLGCTPAVEALCTGGFRVDTEFTPTALRELAKMDGALIVSTEMERIVSASVHLVPDGRIATIETGTRHRTADRVAKQTGVPVVTVSASMGTIELFMDQSRHAIERPEQIIGRAGQALSTLSRYRERLREGTRALNLLEIQDQVSARDVAVCAQRLEMVRRLEDELRGYIAALGIDGRLLELQLTELVSGLENVAMLLEEDYRSDDPEKADFRVSRLRHLDTADLLDAATVAETVGLDAALDARLSPRGYRQLSQIPRVPTSSVGRLVQHFGTLQALLAATATELMGVEGVGERRARSIRDALARIAETTFDGTD